MVAPSLTPRRPGERIKTDRRDALRHLLALGTGKRHAIATAMSSKNCWHLSKTLATQTGLTNEWLHRQGLISIRDEWMKAHGYA